MVKEKAVVQWDPFQAMDRLDGEQIVAELEGRVADALVYQYTNDQGVTVTGLSKAGVDAVCREMAKQGEVLRELDLEVIDLGDALLAKCRVGRYAIRANQQTGETQEVLLDTAFGVKHQPKIYWSKRANGYVENPFAYEQAAMKAARNAKMRLIREDLRQKVIAWAVEQGAVRQVEPEPEPEAPRRPARQPHQQAPRQGDPTRDIPREAYELARKIDWTEARLQAKWVAWTASGKSPDEFMSRLKMAASRRQAG